MHNFSRDNANLTLLKIIQVACKIPETPIKSGFLKNFDFY